MSEPVLNLPDVSLSREYLGLHFTIHSETPRTSARLVFRVVRAADDVVLRSTPVDVEAADHFDEVVDAWVAEKIGAVSPPKVPCGSCGAELEPVGSWDTTYQYDNALWVTFGGGYGMFIDPFDSGSPKVVICHACAHALCDQHPWIEKLLRSDGHSHNIKHVPALIGAGHHGWDLDQYRLDEGDELAAHLAAEHPAYEESSEQTGSEMWLAHWRGHQANREIGHNHHRQGSDGIWEDGEASGV